MNTGKTVQFKEWKCSLWLEKYRTGHTALILRNAETIKEDGYEMGPNTEDIAVASINVPEANLKENEIVVKDYSENEGMLAVLIRANIVHMPHKYVKSGFVHCPVCILKITPDNLKRIIHIFIFAFR